MIIAQMWDDNRTDVGCNIIHLWDSQWFEKPYYRTSVGELHLPPLPKYVGAGDYRTTFAHL